MRVIDFSMRQTASEFELENADLRRFITTILLILVVFACGWLLYHRDQIRYPGDIVALVKEKLASISAGGFDFANQTKPTARDPSTIRIASFKLNATSGRAEQPAAMHLMTEICRQFDLIALQEVSLNDRSGNKDRWLSQLAESLSRQTGSTWQFITGGKTNEKQFALLFDNSALELDHLQAYTVNDPDSLLTRSPLVGWFRTRRAPPESAFTFTVANVQLDSKRPDLELDYLDELFRAIRNDGRGEDDVIIAGDFNAGDRGLGLVRERSSLTWVVSGKTTDTLRKGQYDNLVFSELATVEFTGYAEVFDFLKFYNLELEDAIGISEHLPVWAEFSVFESGTPGRVADAAKQNRR